MKKIIIYTTKYIFDTYYVDNFEIDTIKSYLNGRTDFLSLVLINENNSLMYANGIILSFDETLDIALHNPKYNEIVADIKRHRNSINEVGKSCIKGYGSFLEKVIFYPFSKSFHILYTKPLLITDLIPDFKTDRSILETMQPIDQKLSSFFIKNKSLLYLFDRLVKTIKHESNIQFLNFNLFLNFRSNEDILNFFMCYEIYFEIENYELYEKFKMYLLKKYGINQEEIKPIDIKELIGDISLTTEIIDSEQTYYETFGIAPIFGDEELKGALRNKLLEIQLRFDGDDIVIKEQTDIILDKFNVLINLQKKKAYDNFLILRYIAMYDQSESKLLHNEKITETYCNLGIKYPFLGKEDN